MSNIGILQASDEEMCPIEPASSECDKSDSVIYQKKKKSVSVTIKERFRKMMSLVASPEEEDNTHIPEEMCSIEPAAASPESVESVTVSVTIEERFTEMMGLVASLKEEDNAHIPLLVQVPTILGKKIELEKYFKPRIVSFGPVHHDEKELERGELYKLHLAQLLIEKDCPNKEKLYKNILGEIESFKTYYDEIELIKKFGGNDEDLAWIFFVDGCALIKLLQYYAQLSRFQHYYMNVDRDEANLIATDLILLDNQVPFKVLNLIMKFINIEGDSLSTLIRSFAIEIMAMMHFERWAKGLIVETEKHMLELIWKNIVEKEICHTTVATSPRSSSDENLPRIEDTSHFRGEDTSHFRGVKDLQAAGIILEPNNSSSSLRDISFNRGIFFSKLKIPRFRLNEQGKFLIFNLIAFEMHPNFDDERIVTSYISFLNSLITSKADLAELRKAEILFNCLPNDEEVLKTFQELTSVLKPFPDIFSSTKSELTNYFSNKKSVRIGTWLSEAMSVYCKSPWTIIAFISATCLLIMTIIQTVFSILAYAWHK